jgi:hypothetical protein
MNFKTKPEGFKKTKSFFKIFNCLRQTHFAFLANLVGNFDQVCKLNQKKIFILINSLFFLFFFVFFILGKVHSKLCPIFTIKTFFLLLLKFKTKLLTSFFLMLNSQWVIQQLGTMVTWFNKHSVFFLIKMRLSIILQRSSAFSHKPSIEQQ